MKYTRLYSDDNGESHFEDCDVTFELVDFAPPAPPLDFASLGKAASCSIIRGDPGWEGDWHPAPARAVHFYLSGGVEAETSDGEIRRIGAGEIVLVEDTWGRGHRSRIVGSTDVVIAVVTLADTE